MRHLLRVAAPVLLVVALAATPASALTFPEPAPAGAERAVVPAAKQKRAAKVGTRAVDAITTGKLVPAERLTRKALRLDPDCPEGLFAAAMLLLRDVEAGTAEDPDAATALARALFRRLIEIDPESMYAAIGAQSAEGAPSRPVLEAPDPGCPAEAQAHWNDAEAHLAAGRNPAAVEAYDLAIRGCPANARLRLYSGDAVFAQGDLGGALLRYEAALSIEPCYWAAHRFAGDVHFQEGRVLEGVASLVRSVACNPWYEPGRRFFYDMAAGLELPLMWPEERGPRVFAAGDKLEISVVTVDHPHEAATQAWVMYGLMKAGLGDPSTKDAISAQIENFPEISGTLSPLTVEVTSLALALERFRNDRGDLAIPKHRETRFWDLIAEASAADRLPEAAFFLIADPWLASEFQEFAASEEGRDRLNAFVRNLLLGGGTLDEGDEPAPDDAEPAPDDGEPPPP